VSRALPSRLYAAAWVPFFAAYASLYAAGGMPPAVALRAALMTTVPCALLGWLVLAVPDRLPWRDERRGAFLLTQLALAAAYAVLSTAVVILMWVLETRLTTGRLPTELRAMTFAWQAVIGALLYLAIAGGAYAWRGAERAREAAARAARADALRAQAELAALRSQLNPHFLLNTLHAALGLVRRDPALAERALERLGEVLNYGLRMHRDGLDQVTLEREWSFVRSYLEIESLRLEERLRLRLDADPEAMDGLVPPFVLQPLVENAIRHAVAPRKSGGTVAIAARRERDRLHLEVCDDGPGLPAGAAAPARDGEDGGGLGLQLLRERLALLYGGRARLSLEAADGGGLRARIELPLDRDAARETA
jgi:signal transduction histidine kinase